MDILDLDDGVVDDDANRQHHRQQRQHVDREAEHPEHGEGRDDRDRNGDGGDQRRAPGTQEHEDHEDDQRHTLGQRFEHTIDRGADEIGFVVEDGGARALRKCRTQQGLFGRDTLGHRERIRGRLPDDPEPDRGLAAGEEFETLVLGADFHLGDLAEADLITVPSGDDDTGEILAGRQLGIGLDRDFPLAGRQPSPGKVHVLPLDRGFDILNGHAACRERGAVDPDPHRVAALAADVDARHPRHGGHAVDDDPAQEVGQLHSVEVGRGDADPENRLRVGIDALDHRRIDAVRQPRQHAANSVAHIGGGGIGIAANVELDRNRGTVVLAERGNIGNALDAGNRALDHLSDPAFDHLVRGPLVDSRDRDHGRIDLRVFPHRQRHQPGNPRHAQEQADHTGENRPLDRNIGKLHRLLLPRPRVGPSGPEPDHSIKSNGHRALGHPTKVIPPWAARRRRQPARPACRDRPAWSAPAGPDARAARRERR